MMIHVKTRLDPKLISRQAETFKALSSPARVAIVTSLAERDMSVNELVDMLEHLECPCSCERTNISKHLAVLREAGIVSVSEDAQRRIYRLRARCLVEAISCTARLANA